MLGGTIIMIAMTILVFSEGVQLIPEVVVLEDLLEGMCDV